MIYDLLARVYNSVNREVDYCSWADFIEEAIKRNYKGKAELVLDLGCGTGNMTLELARRGYDMTGVDYSWEMLNVAGEVSDAEGFNGKILWLCQDMRSFELYGTVDVTVSCLDCINHLCSPSDVKKCFSLVHNYLNPDGLFIFDVNGKYKFENVYADNTFVMEEDGAYCIWQNDYNKRNKTCDFYITFFEERDDGAYVRYDETQRERMYTLRSLFGILKSVGFEPIGAYKDFEFNQATDGDERIFIVAKCKK